MNPLRPNFQRMRSLYTRSTNGPLVFNLLAHSKCKAQSLLSQGPYGDMSSNDMSCDDVSPSDTSSGATSSFSIKWHVWYNRYYISILLSSLMKCHQMTCHYLPRHHTCHVITWHVINDNKLKTCAYSRRVTTLTNTPIPRPDGPTWTKFDGISYFEILSI